MAPARPALLRSLHRWDLVALTINGVIGAGIFGLPSRTFQLAGDYSLPAFIACGAFASLIVLSFAEVASRFDSTGGPYLYTREAYGPAVGFQVGWLMWLARLTAFAANINLLAEYLGTFHQGAASGAPRVVILTSTILLLTAINVRGVRNAATAGNIFAAGKLIPLAVFILAGLFAVEPARFTFSRPPGWPAFSQSMLLLVYAFTGFEMAVIPSGEIRDPRRTLPRAVLTGMAIIVTFYVLIQFVAIGTLPGLANSTRPLADSAATFLGPWGAYMIAAGVVVSLAGNLNILVLAASRLLFAMAERRELPAILARIHPRFCTPAVAILVTSAVKLALALSGTFLYLLTLSTVARLVSYLLTCSALPVFRRRTNAPPAAFRAPAGTAAAVAAAALSVWLLAQVSAREARDTAIAAAIGLVLYLFSRRRDTIRA